MLEVENKNILKLSFSCEQFISVKSLVLYHVEKLKIISSASSESLWWNREKSLVKESFNLVL